MALAFAPLSIKIKCPYYFGLTGRTFHRICAYGPVSCLSAPNICCWKPNGRAHTHRNQQLSSARLCGSRTVLMVAAVITRRTPSPQIRARDTSLDSAANGSAGVNSAPNVDARVNGATHLGEQRRGDHEDSTNYRNLAEHNVSLPWASYALLRS